jgi:hypothetical protein
MKLKPTLARLAISTLTLILSCAPGYAQTVADIDDDTFSVTAAKAPKSFFAYSATTEAEKAASDVALKMAATHGKAKGCMFLAQYDGVWTERERKLMWVPAYKDSGHMIKIDSGRVFTLRDSIESLLYNSSPITFVCMRSKPENNVNARRYASPDELLAFLK